MAGTPSTPTANSTIRRVPRTGNVPGLGLVEQRRVHRTPNRRRRVALPWSAMSQGCLGQPPRRPAPTPARQSRPARSTGHPPTGRGSESRRGAAAEPQPPRLGSATHPDRAQPGERTSDTRAGSAGSASPRRRHRDNGPTARSVVAPTSCGAGPDPSLRRTIQWQPKARETPRVLRARPSRPKLNPRRPPPSSSRTRGARALSFSQCSPISRSATVPPR